jgi:hypothetical protein
LPQVLHPLFVHKFRTRDQGKSSDKCLHISDTKCAQNCAADQRRRLECEELGRKTRDRVGWDCCGWD